MVLVARRKQGAAALEAAETAEAELIARACKGDAAAEGEIFRTHRRQVAATLYRVMGRQDELEDLVQEVFVVAFRRLGSFRGDARLSTWLYRISVNVALGEIRRRRRRPAPLLVEAPINREASDPRQTPQARLEQRQDRGAEGHSVDRIGPEPLQDGRKRS